MASYLLSFEDAQPATPSKKKQGKISWSKRTTSWLTWLRPSPECRGADAEAAEASGKGNGAAHDEIFTTHHHHHHYDESGDAPATSRSPWSCSAVSSSASSSSSSSNTSSLPGIFPLRSIRDLPLRPHRDEVIYMPLTTSKSAQSCSTVEEVEVEEEEEEEEDKTNGENEEKIDVEEVAEEVEESQVPDEDSIEVETCDCCDICQLCDGGCCCACLIDDEASGSSNQSPLPDSGIGASVENLSWSSKLFSSFMSTSRKKKVFKNSESESVKSLGEDMLKMYILRLEEEANYFKTSTPTEEQEFCDCAKCQSYYLEYYSRYLDDFEKRCRHQLGPDQEVNQASAAILMDDFINNGMSSCSIM